jgi:hypothetical protein
MENKHKWYVVRKGERRPVPMPNGFESQTVAVGVMLLFAENLRQVFPYHEIRDSDFEIALLAEEEAKP